MDAIRKKRKRLTNDQKIKLVETLKSTTKSYEEVAREYGLAGKSSVANIVKEMKEQASSGTKLVDNTCKALRKPKYPLLEECLIKWIRTKRTQQGILTGLLIKEKATWERMLIEMDKNDDPTVLINTKIINM